MISGKLNPVLHPVLRRRFDEFRISRTADIALAGVRGGAECSISVGDGSFVRAHLIFERRRASIKIGNRSYIGASHLITASAITVGDDVLISWGVTVVDHHSHSLRFSERSADVAGWIRGQKDWTHVKTAPIHIESKVWIGFGASILSGVTVGEGAVVGAGSVVTSSVPPWSVWAGNPARLIRELGVNER
jgi:acetyltransferase-like isoleucine patch superfamily enzyme